MISRVEAASTLEALGGGSVKHCARCPLNTPVTFPAEGLPQTISMKSFGAFFRSRNKSNQQRCSEEPGE